MQQVLLVVDCHFELQLTDGLGLVTNELVEGWERMRKNNIFFLSHTHSHHQSLSYWSEAICALWSEVQRASNHNDNFLRRQF